MFVARGKGMNASAEVRILFNNNFQFNIIRQFSDQEGRFIIIDVKINNKVIKFANKFTSLLSKERRPCQ